MKELDECGELNIKQTRGVLDQIANKWSVLILSALCNEPCRFNELMRRLDGITHKALSDALKRLERNGLVHRQILDTAPIGVEYSITALGLSLKDPFGVLYKWARTNGHEIKRAQQDYDKLSKKL